MNSERIKGFLMAAGAAAAYGTNPAFAIPLYAEGMNADSVLLFRYLLGLPVLALIMWSRGVSFRLNKGETGCTALLGILMAFSSLTLFESYNFMNSGIASTLLFVYPVMVAVIMIFLFHEKFRPSVALCLVLMGAGLLLLMRRGDGEGLSMTGTLLVMISALTYALYIIFVNMSKIVKEIPTTRLLFYVLGWGCLVYLVRIATGSPLTVPPTSAGWINLAALAIIPTVISLAFTTRAIQLIGSTPTAILGGLEPVAAVILSVTVLGQTLTPRELLGGMLIIIATTIVVADNTVDRVILHVRKMFPRRRRP